MDLNFNEVASDDEEEVVNFDEASRDIKEELGKTFYYVGAKFKMIGDLCEKKAQSLDKQFNCPVTTARSSKNQFLVLQCKHGGNYRKARKGHQEQQQPKDEKEDEEDKIKNRSHATYTKSRDLSSSDEKGSRRHKTGRKQCSLRIYASVGRDAQNPWEVRQVFFSRSQA
ncbi:hypothetical protein G6F42_019254 [Rhizopus arrhizus]|nr:hypothetical protein G6F42_019254 [Rhizopus arrhizus]